MCKGMTSASCTQQCTTVLSALHAHTQLFLHVLIFALALSLQTSQTRVFESSYNGSAAASSSTGSAVPYDLWCGWNESEVAEWVLSHPSLKP